MNPTIFFAVIAAVAVFWYISASILIVNELIKRKHKIQFVIIRLMLPVYAHRYKRMTIEETGKVGLLCYHWIFSINVALIFAAAAIVAKFL